MNFTRISFLFFIIAIFSFYKASASENEVIQLNSGTESLRIGKSIYYLKDDSQRLSFEQVRTGEFDQQFIRSSATAPNFGSTKAVWNKFTVINHSEKKWFLTVENYNIDTLTFYYPDSAGIYHKSLMGSAHPYQARQYGINPYVLELPLKATDTATFYLKIESNVFQYPLSIVSEEQLLKTVQYKNIGLGIYFGFMLVIIFYGAVVYLAFRDKGYLFYVIYVALTGLMIFEREGLMAAVWAGKYSAMWAKTSFFIALASASMYPFTCAFLETKKNTPILHKLILYVFLPATFIAPVFDMLGYKYIASLGNQVSGLAGLLLLYATAIFIYRKGFKHARFYIIACSCYFIGIVIFILKTNAILPHNAITNSALEIGSILEMILFSFSLGDKLNLVRKKKETAESSLRISQLEKLSAEKSKEFKEQFLANMSHEIRTPMNAILGMTNLTLNTPVNTKQKEYLTAIKKSSENLLVIINDILDLSKLEAGKMELESISFRIKDMIEQASVSMQFKAKEKGLQLVTEISTDVPAVIKGDPARLTQVLINLIGNAIKFTAAGQVAVKVVLDNANAIRFRVIDTGIGIPKDKLGSLFESFTQVDASTSRKYGGTGLGLSISKTLIELHGGKIEVSSQEGKGSEFAFVIPLIAGNENEIEADNKPAINAALLNGIKILVAEDNEYNQIVIEDTLKGLIENVTVDIAENGKVAVEKHTKNTYDIILMDMNMPEMGGIEATEYIRTKTDSGKNKIPILALTANVMEKDMARITAAGMNGSIPKPFTQDELLTGLLKYYKNVTAPVNTKNTATQQNNPKKETEIVTENPAVKGKEDEQQSGAPPAANNETVTDLAFLSSFCDDNRVRMKKYIDMYLAGIDENLKKVDDTHNNKDYYALSRIAHTMKPHFNYMGMAKAKKLSETIEEYAGENKNTDQLPGLIAQLHDLCKKSVSELSAFK
jgi:signal transduction histidine kinase/CheY-like chemotaxis protein/HPt (histidine-containing phosphotransfer) domain-containing protein